MKSIKQKLEAMLEAKAYSVVTDDIGNLVAETSLDEAVKSEFTTVTEGLVLKLGKQVAFDLIESIELELANNIAESEESVSNYIEYMDGNLQEKADEYAAVIDEGADEYAAYIDDAVTEYKEYVQENMNELVADQMTETTAKLDEYINYVTETYMAEHAEIHEGQIKANLLDDLVGDLRVVFEKHNLELPDAINVVEELEDDIAVKESTIDKLVAKVNQLDEKLNESQRKIAFNESTKDLTMSQVERVENIIGQLELSESEYSDKLESICEMIISNAESTDQQVEGSEDYNAVITEDVTVTDTHADEDHSIQDGSMSAYIAAAKRIG